MDKYSIIATIAVIILVLVASTYAVLQIAILLFAE